MRKKYLIIKLYVSFLSLLCISFSLAQDFDSEGYIHVYTSLTSSRQNLYSIQNNTKSVSNRYLHIYVEDNNKDIFQIFRNSIFERNGTSYLVTEVFNQDNITIVTKFLKFKFTATEITNLDLDEYEETKSGNIKFFKNIGRSEIIIAFFGIGLAIALIIRWLTMK